MKDYTRKINYHETDKMGVVHHSNYIKYMEEARIDFLEQIGYGYAKLEKDGIVSPVVGVECEYKHPTTFGDTINIHVEVEEFKGIKLVIAYTMTNQDGVIVLVGKSKHCFLNNLNRPIALSKQFPDLDQKLKKLACKKQ